MQFFIHSLANEKLSNKSEHGRTVDTLTFLKSNYKYKRRCVLPPQCDVTEMQHVKCNCADNEEPEEVKENSSENSSKSDQLTVRIILSLFIAIIANLMQRCKLLTRRQSKRLQHNSAATAATVADDDDDDYAYGGDICGSVVDDDNDDDVVNIDSDEINHQRNYDKVSIARCESASSTRCHLMRRCRHCRRRFRRCDRRRLCCGPVPVLPRRRLHQCSVSSWSSSSSSSMLPLPLVGNAPSILMTLFIALALSVRNVQAGACWQSALDSGKCSEIFSLNITKTECCGASQEFSYTDRELTSVEYFFATAIGGGMECAPCIESCKNVKCGANKKCVKRKGRPKCICAPECGAATRRKKQQEKLYRGHEHHNEQLHRPIAGLVIEDDDKSARDIRSLSSEITNVNLGLDVGGNTRLLHQQQHQHQQQQQQQQNQNQRKIIIMQSQSQQKPQINKREPKPKRLLIANVEQFTEKPSTRRLQILSNVRTRSSNSNSNSNSNEHVAGNARSGSANERRRHNSNKNDDATRSLETRRGSLLSRHKSNTNNASNNNNQNSNELELTKFQRRSQTHNSNYNDGRVRHIHQNGRHVEEKNAPNHAEVEDKQQQQQHHRERHRQFHRKRKHHNSDSNNNNKNNNNNNINNRSRQKKLKDQRNANNSTSFADAATSQALATATTATTTSLTSSTYKAMSDTQSSVTAAAAAAAGTKVMLQTITTTTTTTTPVNSSTSVVADRRLLNRGSNSAASSSSPSSTSLSLSGEVHLLPSTLSSLTATTTTTTAAAEATMSATVGGGFGAGVDRAGGSSNSVNSDDLTFLDGFYDKFNLHGFPSQQHSAVTQLEHMHNAHPVCGTDGRTYNTECHMKKRACRTDNPNLQVAYRGHCKTTCNGVKCLNGLTCVEDHYTIPHCIVCKIDCPQDEANTDGDGYGFGRSAAAAAAADVIEPSRAVCGADGKTYKSTCDINRMICTIGRSIAVAYPGPCRVDRVTCSDINCGPKHTCLVDLLTHEPRCVSCRYKCSRKRRPASLRLEEGKICGVNNRTYHSWCEMRKDSCSTGFFIDVKTPGECLESTLA